MSDILVNNNFYIGSVSACIVDLTPPTFAGVNFLDVESRGQIRAGWAAASDATAPIRYEVYIKASTATGLFSTSNIVALTPNLQYDIFTLADGSFLVNGTTYYVGIRAIDGVSNRDSNTVSMNVISTGVLTSIDVYKNEGAFVVNELNFLQGTFWGTKNNSLAITPDSVMGTGSYQVYDKTGATIVGLSQSGISVDANGQYKITAVSASSLVESLNHSVIKLTINIDGEDRVNYIPFVTEKPQYKINGQSYLNNANTVIGSFWITKDEKVLNTNLGTGSYQAYAPDGTLIPGLTQSGIIPDVNGVFTIAPFALPGYVDPTAAYNIKITLTVEGKTRSTFILIDAQPSLYGIRAQFSINASNQLLGTFWPRKGNDRPDPTILGTASYQVYDKDGVAVVGLSQTGITADSNGLYKITAVSASLLTDLTHYTVKITMNIGGSDHTDFKGFTLLGT